MVLYNNSGTPFQQPNPFTVIRRLTGDNIIANFILMKFLCDDNLGKLARYLRMLGYDTFFKTTISDAELISVMLKHDRLVLTRDHKLLKRIDFEKCLLLESNSPEEQLKAVIDNFKIKINKNNLFSRCLECNESCNEVIPDDIADEVFPYILKTRSRFQRCPSCKRVYWQGSHYKDMLERLKAVIGENSV